MKFKKQLLMILALTIISAAQMALAQATTETYAVTIQWLKKKQAEDSVAAEKALQDCRQRINKSDIPLNELLLCMHGILGD